MIFQRTDQGRAEIRSKQYGLTQSERLILIIVDGVSTYGQLRSKLKSIAKERFDRALRKLCEKGLLLEVMFPLDNQVPDLIDPDLMDKYLRQEDSDPVSIISFDPDEEHGDASVSNAGTATKQVKKAVTGTHAMRVAAVVPDAEVVTPTAMAPQPVIDAQASKAKALPKEQEVSAPEVKKMPQQAAPSATAVVPPSPSAAELEAKKREERLAALLTRGDLNPVTLQDRLGTTPSEPPPSIWSQLYYVLLVLGVLLFGAPLLARFMNWIMQ